MIVLVPSALALLPEYAGLEDPLAEVRAACTAVVGDLLAASPASVAVVAAPARPDNAARGVPSPAGARIGRHLLAAAGYAGPGADGRVVDDPLAADGVLVVANGTASRSEKAPGHLDERSFAFDDEVRRALLAGDGRGLRGLDARLGEALWCFDVPALQLLGSLVDGRPAALLHDDDPFGVQYWVATWR